MNDASIEQLMHDVLDGVATVEEKQRLEQRLATEPVLRERFSELRGMFEALGRVPLVDPPADLHAELMHRLEAEAGRTRNPGWLVAFADAFRARPVPAFAMTGLAIAALALLLWSGGRSGLDRLAGKDAPVAGTMAPATAPATRLEAGDARVSVTALITGRFLVFTIDGAAPSGAAFDVETGIPGIDGRIEGEGASLAGIGASTGRVSLTLERSVLARLTIDTHAAPIGTAEVSLATPAGTDRHEFALGPRGEGP